MDVIDRVPGLAERAAGLRQEMADARLRARAYTREVGDDLPEVRDWTWPGAEPRPRRRVESADPDAWRSSPSTPAPAASSCAWSATTTASSPTRSWRRRRPRWTPTSSAARWRVELADAEAVAHRIVHGGDRYRAAVVIDEAVRRGLRELTDLAPLHQPKSLAALDSVSRCAARRPGGGVL